MHRPKQTETVSKNARKSKLVLKHEQFSHLVIIESLRYEFCLFLHMFKHRTSWVANINEVTSCTFCLSMQSYFDFFFLKKIKRTYAKQVSVPFLNYLNSIYLYKLTLMKHLVSFSDFKTISQAFYRSFQLISSTEISQLVRIYLC